LCKITDVLTDGTVKHIHGSDPGFSTKPDNFESFGTDVDVTATQRAEEKLRHTEADLP